MSNLGNGLIGAKGVVWAVGSVVFISPSSGVPSLGLVIPQLIGYSRRVSLLVFLRFPLRILVIYPDPVFPSSLGRRRWSYAIVRILRRYRGIVLLLRVRARILLYFVFVRVRCVLGPWSACVFEKSLSGGDQY